MRLSDWSCGFDRGVLRVTTPTDDFRFAAEDPETGLRKAARCFSTLHGYPPPQRSERSCSLRPEVSCIIVVNGNHWFASTLMIDNLLESSAGHALEILVVLNGDGPGIAWRDDVRLIRVASSSVARAYNAGAAAARAPILAFFHDDCLLDQPDWIERVGQAFARGADAVSPEIRYLERIGTAAIQPLPILKNVPLVIRRETFRQVGGYDEQLLIGYEDLEFTLRLLQHGLRPARLRLGYRHFGGMSSCLRYLPRPDQDLLFATLAPPPACILAAVQDLSRRGDARSAVFRALSARQLVDALSPHGDRVRSTSGSFAELADALIARASAEIGCSARELLALPIAGLDRACLRVDTGEGG